MYNAEAHIQEGNLSEALTCLRDADGGAAVEVESSLTGCPLGELPPKAATFLNMATLNFLSDNLAEAKSCLDQVSDLPTEGPALALALVYLHLRQGDGQSALRLLKRRNTEPDLRVC